ncbi:MAG: DUF1092 family protein [Acaryochloridaceae cyanobacterium CSU_5_19]|nr:DUF1092 family protein [Acaryochloridaceae cyanobacterium CSU_5_19]
MRLAQWLQQRQPLHLQVILAELNGLILAAGFKERYLLATFDDSEATAAAQIFAERKQSSQGLHFLLVQPDDSAVTFTGLWLLRG